MAHKSKFQMSNWGGGHGGAIDANGIEGRPIKR